MSVTGKVARYESSDRVAFFLNDLFEHIDLCRCSILFVIDEQQHYFSIHLLCDEVISDDPCSAGFPFAFGLDGHSYLTDARSQFCTL